MKPVVNAVTNTMQSTAFVPEQLNFIQKSVLQKPSSLTSNIRQ